MSDIVDKIRKLFALSKKNTNPHEAALAAQRAAELIVEHRILPSQLEETAEERLEQHEVETVKRMTPWRYILLKGITSVFGADCITVTTSWRDTRGKRAGRVTRREVSIKVVGRRSDIDAIKYMYEYFKSEIERLAEFGLITRRQAQRQIGPRVYKNAFRVGCAMTIKERLERTRSTTRMAVAKAALTDPAMSRALERIDGDRLAIVSYMAANGIKRASLDADVSDTTGAVDGVIAGRDVDLGHDKDQLGAGPKRLKEGNG